MSVNNKHRTYWGWNFKELLRNKLRFTWGSVHVSYCSSIELGGLTWALISVPIMLMHRGAPTKGQPQVTGPQVYVHRMFKNVASVYARRWCVNCVSTVKQKYTPTLILSRRLNMIIFVNTFFLNASFSCIRVHENLVKFSTIKIIVVIIYIDHGSQSIDCYHRGMCTCRSLLSHQLLVALQTK
jgi:hypothetical protein